MANKYLKAARYAALAVVALQRNTVLPQVVTRYDGNNFRGALDDKVHFRLPGVTQARDYEWRTRTNPIVLDKIGRTMVDIALDTHSYSAVPITDEELTLDLSNFVVEVLDPQVTAVIERIEGKVLGGLAAAPFKITDLDAAEADDPWKWAVNAKFRLDAQHTPVGNRQLVVGTNVGGWLMESDRLVSMDSAQATTAFREATLGRMAGFNIVTSDRLGANDIYALHPSALVLANVAPDVPQGVTYGAKASEGGVSMRVIRDYDANYARDRSLVSTFTGISSVNDEYQTDANGLVLDAEGSPQITGNNVRGAKGQFTPAA